MRRPVLAALASAAALALTTIALSPSADAAPPPSSPGSSVAVAHRQSHVCAEPGPEHVSCKAIRNDAVDANGTVVNQTVGTPVTGSLGPADIQSAYKLPGTGGGKTVAIVDAYHDPSAEADLANYRSFYGLPECSSATGCFAQVNQNGVAGAPPATDAGWAQEISLDLDMVSATCPGCHILLVETTSASFADLGAGVTYAAGRTDVAAISNSYGGSDTRGTSYPAYTNAAGAGKAVTASTGDSGYGDQSPASFPGVVAVGGTSLSKASNARGWTESAWSGAGSGCSRYNARPSYQTSVTRCSYKANADVSAVADPNTGVAVYDSTAYQGASGWMQFGGTSASSPIIASVYALSGNTANAGSLPWTHQGNLWDVSSGSNGRCTTKVLCTAGVGWDGPTGLGTPNGTGAF